jgi:hypothetical protein
MMINKNMSTLYIIDYNNMPLFWGFFLGENYELV